MHHIYHTQGFVLSSKNMGEANKVLVIFTRELGLIRAVVQSVRLGKSKLRFSLQDFSHIKVDLVRGKDVWRVTSAKSVTSFPLVRRDKASLVMMVRISQLLERFCGLESVNEKIFDDFIQSLYLLDDENVETKTKEALEIHLVLRIMNELGYIGDSLILSKHLSSPFDEEKIEQLLKERRSIISHINKALFESQL